MAKNDLKKLGRTDLLRLLLEAEEENDRLKEQVAELRAQLDDRSLRMENCGDLAAAALELNGVFAAAEEACRQYTENIRSRSADIEARCSRMERESAENAAGWSRRRKSAAAPWRRKPHRNSGGSSPRSDRSTTADARKGANRTNSL